MISGTVVESKEVAAQLPYGMADGWMDGSDDGKQGSCAKPGIFHGMGNM